jgi:hypothetical protein
MPLSTYDITVPVYLTLLGTLSATLDKAAAFAAQKKIDPAVLINDRLAPDMWSLAQQVKAVCNHAVRGPFRLAGVAVPQLTGGEATFDDLKARIVGAKDHLKGLVAGQFTDAETRTIVFPAGDDERKMSGGDYLLKFSLPNFYFHLSMVYAILRHNGVPITKEDFVPD